MLRFAAPRKRGMMPIGEFSGMMAQSQGAPMKSILIPVDDHDLMPAAMQVALGVARKFDSYVEGAALGPDVAELVAADFSMSGALIDDRARRELFDRARRIFEKFMLEHGVERHRENGGPGFGWFGETIVSDASIGEYGRVFDLIVVGRPGSGIRQPRGPTLEAALFESGRPVLIAPPHPAARLGETIAIAWSGSTDTARTVAFAMPLLVRAQDVIILNIPGAERLGPDEEQLAKSLRRHNVRARVFPIAEAPRSSGAALLDTAALLGADLLIKGGYTRSRLRQLIFGNVTSEILAQANLAVFMAH